MVSSAKVTSAPNCCCPIPKSRSAFFPTVKPTSPWLEDARIVTEYCVGGVPAAKEALLADDDPFVAAWKPFGKLPCAFALWVAHGNVEPETVEALQHALTFGLEHGYEAVLDSAFSADPGLAYAGLAHFDYIFDNQKDKALKKCWDSGLKVAPRANPG